MGLVAPCEMYFTLLPWVDVRGNAMITYDGILLHENINPEGQVGQCMSAGAVRHSAPLQLVGDMGGGV